MAQPSLSASFKVPPTHQSTNHTLDPFVVSLAGIPSEMLDGGFYAEAKILDNDNKSWGYEIVQHVRDSGPVTANEGETVHFVFRGLKAPAREGRHEVRVGVFYNLAVGSAVEVRREVFFGGRCEESGSEAVAEKSWEGRLVLEV